MGNFEEKLTGLIAEWKRCLDYESSQQVTCKIGVHIEFLNSMPKNPEKLSPENRYQILELIHNDYYPAYDAARKLVASGM